MNDSFSVSAIGETQDLFEHFQFNSSDELQIFRQHGPLLLQAIFQCLDLRDLVSSQVNEWYNVHHVERLAKMNFTKINQSLHWCEWAQIAWFPKAFHVMYEQSWQKQIAVVFSTFIFPIISVLNLLSLVLTLIGASRILHPNRTHIKPDLYHREDDLIHVPATWPILIVYCWISIICVVLVDLRGMIFVHLPSYLNPLNYDLGCRAITYLRNVLRYTPTWLLAVMLADRTFGEYRHSDRRLPSMSSSPIRPPVSTRISNVGDINGRSSTILSVNDSVPVNNHHSSPIVLSRPRSPMGPSFVEADEKSLQRKSTAHHRWCPCAPLKHFLCVYRSPIWCSGGFDAISPKNFVLSKRMQQPAEETEPLRPRGGSSADVPPAHTSDWSEVAAGRVGGYLLVGTTVSGLCLINTHTIWLYDINRDWKRCMLTAGNSVILGEFYPYFTQVLQSFLPHLIQLCSIIVLLIIFQRNRGRQAASCRSTNLTNLSGGQQTLGSTTTSTKSSRRCFVQPTQVVIVLSVVSLVFEMPDHFLWLQSRLQDNTFPSLGSYSNSNANSSGRGNMHAGAGNITNSGVLGLSAGGPTGVVETNRGEQGVRVSVIDGSMGGGGSAAEVFGGLDACRLLRLTDTIVVPLRHSCLLNRKLLDMKSTLLISVILQTWVYLRWIGTFPVLWLASPHFRQTWSGWFAHLRKQFRLSNHLHIRVTKTKPWTEGGALDNNDIFDMNQMGRSCSIAMCCCMCATDFRELSSPSCPVTV